MKKTIALYQQNIENLTGVFETDSKFSDRNFVVEFLFFKITISIFEYTFYHFVIDGIHNLKARVCEINNIFAVQFIKYGFLV